MIAEEVGRRLARAPWIVQERLGHANVSITLGIHSHVAPHMQEEAAAKIHAALGGALVG